MARRLATAAEVRSSYLGFGIFGLALELVGSMVHGDLRLVVVTLGLMLTVVTAFNYGQLWYRLRRRREAA